MKAQKPTSSLPARKPKATAPKSKPAAKPFQSAEFVEDSDDSEGAETEALKKKKVSKITTSAPASSKPAPPKANTPTSKPSKTRDSPSPSPSKKISSGSSDDSGSGASSSSQEGNSSPIRPKQSAAQSFQPQPLQKPSVEEVQLSKSKTDVTNSTKEISSQSESEGDSESSESSSESETGSGDQTSLHSPRKRSPIRKPTPKQPAVSYEPPFGFKASSITIHPSSTAAELFSPANLVGKEIWHITAPASVPIGSIKEVPIQSIQSGTSIMSYKGTDYGLVPETGAEAASNRALLRPSTQTNDYRVFESTIIKTLHLQQLVNLPIHSALSAKPSSQPATVPEVSKQAPRQQPQGLRMRYHPFGASDESESEALLENAVEAPHFRVPNPVETSPAKKRKRAEKDTAMEIIDISPAESKSKKRKTQSETTVSGINDAMDVDNIEDQEPRESQSKDQAHKVTNGTTSSAPIKNGIQLQQTEETQHKKEKKKHNLSSPPPAPISALPSATIKEAETIMPEEVVDGASAIDITHSEAKKARRREERRKRKEAEQEPYAEAVGKMDGVVADLAHHPNQNKDVQKAESQSRDQPAHLPSPKHSSPQKQTTINGESGSVQESSQASPGKQPNNMQEKSDLLQMSSQKSTQKESKDERAKRKEEKKRKKMGSGSA